MTKIIPPSPLEKEKALWKAKHDKRPFSEWSKEEKELQDSTTLNEIQEPQKSLADEDQSISDEKVEQKEDKVEENNIFENKENKKVKEEKEYDSDSVFAKLQELKED